MFWECSTSSYDVSTFWLKWNIPCLKGIIKFCFCISCWRCFLCFTDVLHAFYAYMSRQHVNQNSTVQYFNFSIFFQLITFIDRPSPARRWRSHRWWALIIGTDCVTTLLFFYTGAGHNGKIFISAFQNLTSEHCFTLHGPHGPGPSWLDRDTSCFSEDPLWSETYTSCFVQSGVQFDTTPETRC